MRLKIIPEYLLLKIQLSHNVYLGWRNSAEGAMGGKGKGEEKGEIMRWGEVLSLSSCKDLFWLRSAPRLTSPLLSSSFGIKESEMAGNIYKITKSGKVKNVHPVWIQSEAVTSLPHLKRRPISQGQKLDKTKVELIYFYFFPVLHLDRFWEEILEEITQKLEI